METSLGLKKKERIYKSREVALTGFGHWFNLDPRPALVVPAQGAVQDRIPKLVKLVVHLVGAAGKILPCEHVFLRERGDTSSLSPLKPLFWNLTGGWHGWAGRGLSAQRRFRVFRKVELPTRCQENLQHVVCQRGQLSWTGLYHNWDRRHFFRSLFHPCPLNHL